MLLCMGLLFSVLFGGCTQGEHEPPAAEAVSEKQTTETLKYEYETRELYAKRDENQIYGVIYVPQGAGEKMPADIFSHGLGGNYQVGAQYAKALAEKGYVVS